VSSAWLSLPPATAAPLGAVPRHDIGDWLEHAAQALERGWRLGAWLGSPGSGGVEMLGVLLDDETGRIHLAATVAPDGRFRSLTPDFPQAHLFERELAEQCGAQPEGHPWLRPVRWQAAGAGGIDAAACATGEFARIAGDAVHEVAVGPVHAGIIEPGHFRFQCAGEEVLLLEIALGYQHRGVERALRGGPGPRTFHYAETLAGDTSIGHATACARLCEALSGRQAPPRAHALRAVALELERLANHCGDLGALAGDTGFLPTLSYCGRIRGDFLNLSALLCGSRFGRGLVRWGGVAHDAEPERIERLLRGLDEAERDTRSAVELLWDTPSVVARFEGTGVLEQETARDLGLVGVAARACGLARDVRQSHPDGAFCFHQVAVSTGETGDVQARAWVRWLEMQRSLQFIHDVAGRLPEGPVAVPAGPLRPLSIAVALVEGWRGEICHVATTDEAGRFERYKAVDPSFHNWAGLAMAMRGQAISDFPLCNKSFNLSYCGHDL
jgi:Ni,Fe-hydrogenase III large subunit